MLAKPFTLKSGFELSGHRSSEDILGFVYTERMPPMHVFAVISFLNATSLVKRPSLERYHCRVRSPPTAHV